MSNIPNEYKLIHENRIDIVIGIEYVDFYENKYNTNFFVDLYIEQCQIDRFKLSLPNGYIMQTNTIFKLISIGRSI